VIGILKAKSSPTGYFAQRCQGTEISAAEFDGAAEQSTWPGKSAPEALLTSNVFFIY
jgi:hypothetical protein